jgi:DUF1680 family protein
MKPRFVYPDPRIDDLRGCVAVERGPLVYAIESVDQPDVDLDLIAIDDRKTLWDSDVRVEIDDVIPVTAPGISRHLRVEGLPYLNTPAATDDSTLELTLIPYFRWANRAASTMRVWAPRVDVLAAEESS